jgi:Cu+-exporting ATPase
MADNLSKSATAVKDPVCGMTVNPATAKHRVEHKGRSHYFCCGHCAEKFKANPEKYLVAPARASLVTLGASTPRLAPAPATQGNYICPMCPKVGASGPGPCPTCGMALELEMPPAATRTEYTCPMHPEIVRPGPGSCPICGMALEPRTVTLTQEENPELRDMTRRFWISLALTVPLFAIAMADMVPGMPVEHA